LVSNHSDLVNTPSIVKLIQNYKDTDEAFRSKFEELKALTPVQFYERFDELEQLQRARNLAWNVLRKALEPGNVARYGGSMREVLNLRWRQTARG
jgi:hypothetical protein